MGQGIGALVIVILMIVAQLIKALKENAEAAKQQKPVADEEELVVIPRPKPGKQPKQSKGNKPRLADRQPLRDTFDISAPPKRQSLTKRLSPQGEGERFEADPGTLDIAHIVAPTIDPTVKPELESITGIYEEGATFGERSKSAITLNLGEILAKPEGIIQAVILAEILNRPTWQETSGN